MLANNPRCTYFTLGISELSYKIPVFVFIEELDPLTISEPVITAKPENGNAAVLRAWDAVTAYEADITPVIPLPSPVKVAADMSPDAVISDVVLIFPFTSSMAVGVVSLIPNPFILWKYASTLVPSASIANLCWYTLEASPVNSCIPSLASFGPAPPLIIRG